MLNKAGGLLALGILVFVSSALGGDFDLGIKKESSYINALSGSTSGLAQAYLDPVPEGLSPASVSVSLGYSRQLTRVVGLAAELQWSSTSASDRTLDFMYGFEASLYQDIANTPFISFLAGFDSVAFKNGTTEMNLAIKGELGKRFELCPHVSFSPVVSLLRIFKDSSVVTSVSFAPLSFAILF